MKKDGRLLSQTETARICGVATSTVSAWLHRQDNPLPYFRTTPGRGPILIDRDILNAWLRTVSEEPKVATEPQLLALPVLSSALRRVTTVRNPRATVRDPLRGGFAT